MAGKTADRQRQTQKTMAHLKHKRFMLVDDSTCPDKNIWSEFLRDAKTLKSRPQQSGWESLVSPGTLEGDWTIGYVQNPSEKDFVSFGISWRVKFEEMPIIFVANSDGSFEQLNNVTAQKACEFINKRITSISVNETRRRCEAEDIDFTRMWALMAQWVETGPYTEHTKSALVSPDLIIRSNGTVVRLDKLLWPWSQVLAEKHLAGKSNPEGLPWCEFIASVTQMESRNAKIVREVMEQLHGNTDSPCPRYEGDTGWSWDREQREDKLLAIRDKERIYTTPAVKVSKEWLDALRSLINETEHAIRSGSGTTRTRAGMTWIEQSKFFQGLLHDWYLATQDQD